MKQEPGGCEMIKLQLFSENVVTFMKADVNGEKARSVFQYLKNALPGVFATPGIKWNFTKFLIDSTGKSVARFDPVILPMDEAIRLAIEEKKNALLATKRNL